MPLSPGEAPHYLTFMNTPPVRGQHEAGLKAAESCDKTSATAQGALHAGCTFLRRITLHIRLGVTSRLPEDGGRSQERGPKRCAGLRIYGSPIGTSATRQTVSLAPRPPALKCTAVGAVARSR